MNDQELRQLLRDLPRLGPRPGFSERVTAAAEGPDSAASSMPVFGVRARVLAVAATVALLIGVGGWQMGEARQERAHQAELESLRRESDRLVRELETLRSRAETAPVVYLGGTEDVDYVIDFARFRPASSISTAGL